MKLTLILVALLLLAGCANSGSPSLSPWTIIPSAFTLIVLDEANLMDKYQGLGGTKDNPGAFTVCGRKPDELPTVYIRTDMFLNSVLMAHEARHVRVCKDGTENWHD